MNPTSLSWPLYLSGSLLVFGSWVGLVPTGLGWTGWLMALVGWAIGTRRTRDGSSTLLSRAEQIEKLQILRQQNTITEAEFEQEKRRLLNPPA